MATTKTKTAKAIKAEASVDNAPKRYKVTAASGLNYREGAGTSYASSGVYTCGEVVTITETKTADSSEWGKAENGYWSMMEHMTAI